MQSNTNPAIDTRVPYRTGWPILPVLPVEESHAEITTYFRNPGSVELEICSILKKHSLNHHDFGLCHRLNKGVPLDGQRPTMRIISEKETDSKEARIKAVEEIKCLFERENADVAVEIILSEAYVGFDTDIILSTERDLILQWKSLWTKIEKTIAIHDYLTLDLVRRGEQNRPTFLIGARDANDESWWSTTLPMLRKMVPADIDLELCFLDSVELTGSARRDSVDDCSYLSIGASCGNRGGTRAGTLGGFVELERDGRPLGQFGVSNCHVLGKGIIQGVSDLSVVSPADKDHNKAVSDAQLDIDKKYDRIKDLIKTITDIPSKIPLLELQLDRLHLRMRDAMTVLHLNRRIGDLFAWQMQTTKNDTFDENYRKLLESDSMHDDTYRWALDWCLVRLGMPQERCIDNKALMPDENGKLGIYAPVTEYCEMDPTENYDVVKYGRTSGRTLGVVSAVPSVVRLTANTTDKFGAPTLCRSIVGNKRHTNLFLEPGDSGSLVLLNRRGKRNAQIVGLGFGRNYQISYMQPMDLVLRAMEKKTGAKVTMPTFAGLATSSQDQRRPANSKA
ncbi:hypothetical protein BU24DRAFT_477784 [Aaosphaeria arxii CBS 175.79]|uniref:Uncharacterized protein n=1 Tax=Aaosphaeria arxii CBS 175.79 TaxID=1450172 RepID=A0A6A5XU03_9PLEO|nr:uncharacterized protein BU24DRAFT_477784 [Aaosphaeria arxii CBS 175.79]KAF2016835.1 hypothetical protein BU24DRAFT_477784 [Aaosphaeria arxii CBS 175.79]